MAIDYQGAISSVLWEGPAFKSGLTIGNQIIAVNGTVYDIERLQSAMTEAKERGASIDLLVLDGVHYRTVSVDYQGGLRYPHLQRVGSGKASLDQIFAPKK